MLEHEIDEFTTNLPDDAGFRSPPGLASLQLRRIVAVAPSKRGALLGHYAKLVALGVVMVLLLPVLLVVSVLSIMVARVLGVALFAESSFPPRIR